MNKLEVLIWVLGGMGVIALSLFIMWIKDEFVAFLIWDEEINDE